MTTFGPIEEYERILTNGAYSTGQAVTPGPLGLLQNRRRQDFDAVTDLDAVFYDYIRVYYHISARHGILAYNNVHQYRCILVNAAAFECSPFQYHESVS